MLSEKLLSIVDSNKVGNSQQGKTQIICICGGTSFKWDVCIIPLRPSLMDHLGRGSWKIVRGSLEKTMDKFYQLVITRLQLSWLTALAHDTTRSPHDQVYQHSSMMGRGGSWVHLSEELFLAPGTGGDNQLCLQDQLLAGEHICFN